MLIPLNMHSQTKDSLKLDFYSAFYRTFFEGSNTKQISYKGTTFLEGDSLEKPRNIELHGLVQREKILIKYKIKIRKFSKWEKSLDQMNSCEFCFFLYKIDWGNLTNYPLTKFEKIEDSLLTVLKIQEKDEKNLIYLDCFNSNERNPKYILHSLNVSSIVKINFSIKSKLLMKKYNCPPNKNKNYLLYEIIRKTYFEDLINNVSFKLYECNI